MNKWDQRFLDLAHLVSKWSKDPSTRVGAVIVDPDKRVVSLGYNGAPKGTQEVTERAQKLMRTVHAEANALHFANRSVEGCRVYVTHPTCANCAAHLIQRGIKEVVFYRGTPEFLDRWKDNYFEALAMFGEAGVIVREI